MSFDALTYFEKLKSVGFTEEQARLQADTLRMQSEEQRATMRKEWEKQEEIRRRELATKGDLRETELRLQKEIEKTKYEILKWQIGGWIAMAAIMAKGFGWLGF